MRALRIRATTNTINITAKVTFITSIISPSPSSLQIVTVENRHYHHLRPKREPLP
jgi:hypothetical protein